MTDMNDDGRILVDDDGVTRIEIDGEVNTIPGWSKALGIPVETIRQRLRRGSTPRRSLSTERAERGEAKEAMYEGALDKPWEEDLEAQRIVRIHGQLNGRELEALMGVSHQYISQVIFSAFRKIEKQAKRGDPAAVALRDHILERLQQPHYQELYQLHALE